MSKTTKSSKTASTKSAAKSKTPAAKVPASKTPASSEEQVIILVSAKCGENVRATLSHDCTNICYKTRGDWHSDAYYSEPLSVLVAQGLYKPANTRARKMYAEFYGKLGEKQMKLQEEQERTTEFCRQVLGEEPTAEALKADEDAILTPADKAALKMDEEQEEAALWAQVEEEKEQGKEQAQAEAQDEAETEEPDEAAEEIAAEEIAAEVAEYPAATGATPEVPDELSKTQKPLSARVPSRVPVCQIILNGETEPRPIPADIQLKPGMRLVRKLRDRIIEVTIEEVGFTYNGTTYPTLTHISWAVNPYKIAGNTFFGLPVKKRAAKH